MSSMTTSTADLVRWERPGDENHTWFWDDYLCPAPVTTLTQSFYPYTTQAFPRNQREFWGRKGALRIAFVGGYLYVNPEMGGRPSAAGLERARQSLQRWEQEWLPEVKANLQRLRGLPLGDMGDDELARALLDALQVTMRHWQIEGQVDGPALMAIREFMGWFQEKYPNQGEAEGYRMLQGQAHVPLEASQRLWALTRLVTPEIAATLRAGRRSDLPEPFRSTFEEYLSQFGCRTEQMYDIGAPTWLEEPAQVMAMILRAAEEGMPEPYAALTQPAVLPNLSADEQDLLKRARAAFRAKEDHKFWIEQLTPGAVRPICAELGRRMATCGLLETYADVAHVHLAELIQFGFGMSQPHLPALVAERKADHRRNQQVKPLPWLGTNPDDEPAPESRDGHELKGRAASPGVVTGVAWVLTSPAETSQLRRGEILVCPWTDPDWTPLLTVASAIVTDVGGALSHAAVVAREFGIPAVVATEKATAVIRTGQLIRVDGTAGVVYLHP